MLEASGTSSSHVAGGRAPKNVPAARLYARYGFVPMPRHVEGGPFARPDRDLYVLGNIGGALRALPWEETLSVGDGPGNLGTNGDGRRLLTRDECDGCGQDEEEGDGPK